uniref:Uncharacterized protein n=1 Tax=Avena sativa TaxID=4498 RepID=A0ACD5U1C8_AVESA
MAARRPTSTGKKKIEIKPLESDKDRQVYFSKRRTGLFSKATELAIKCGVKVAVVAFSPGGKGFTYGHPSVESVLQRFLASNSPEAQAAAEVGGGGGAEAGGRDQALEELNQERRELSARLEAEKARKDAAEEAWAKAHAEGIQAAVWLDALVCQMGEEDLVAFKATLEKVDAAVAARTNQLLSGVTVHGGGGGFEFGGTSGGMETMQQQQQEEVMMAMAPPPGFNAAGMAMMPQGFGPHGFPQ